MQYEFIIVFFDVVRQKFSTTKKGIVDKFHARCAAAIITLVIRSQRTFRKLISILGIVFCNTVS